MKTLQINHLHSNVTSIESSNKNVVEKSENHETFHAYIKRKFENAFMELTDIVNENDP